MQYIVQSLAPSRGDTPDKSVRHRGAGRKSDGMESIGGVWRSALAGVRRDNKLLAYLDSGAPYCGSGAIEAPAPCLFLSRSCYTVSAYI